MASFDLRDLREWQEGRFTQEIEAAIYADIASPDSLVREYLAWMRGEAETSRLVNQAMDKMPPERWAALASIWDEDRPPRVSWSAIYQWIVIRWDAIHGWVTGAASPRQRQWRIAILTVVIGCLFSSVTGTLIVGSDPAGSRTGRTIDVASSSTLLPFPQEYANPAGSTQPFRHGEIDVMVQRFRASKISK
jgi:hypothetical protein